MPRAPFQNPFTFGPDGHNIARTKIAWVTGPGGSRVPEYLGWADNGVATSASLWRICRISYNDGSTDNPTDIDWAGGNSDFHHVWDDRAILSYS